MMFILNYLKKIFILCCAAIIISVISLNHLYAQAQDDSSYLAKIAKNTYGILEQVNKLPNYLELLGKLAISWLSPDNSDATSQIQANFSNLGKLFVQDMTTQNSYLTQLNADLFHVPAADLLFPAEKPKILTMLPTELININDITYSTMLGAPPVVKVATAASPYNYIKYASAININHTLPAMNWQGNKDDFNKYINYFGTITAIQSFNSYVLSSQIADGNSLNTVQSSLVSQASDSNWIAQIATEELGKVLRQILLFQSQGYVLLSQMLQTQKQLLTAQIMTNTLLITNNQMNETLLVSRAKGVQPEM